MRKYLLWIPALALFAACNREKAEQADMLARAVNSSLHMRTLIAACLQYESEVGAWPENLHQVKVFVKDFSETMKNPLTGDDPGYEYVKPEVMDEKTVVLYQLRGGKRDLSLKVGYYNGSIRDMEKKE